MTRLRDLSSSEESPAFAATPYGVGSWRSRFRPTTEVLESGDSACVSAMVDLNGYWGPWAASVSKGRKCLEAYNISLDRNKKTNRREQVKMILVCCLLQSHRGLLLPFCSIWVQAGVAQRRGVLGQNSLLPARVFALGSRNGRPYSFYSTSSKATTPSICCLSIPFAHNFLTSVHLLPSLLSLATWLRLRLRIRGEPHLSSR